MKEEKTDEGRIAGRAKAKKKNPEDKGEKENRQSERGGRKGAGCDIYTISMLPYF
jgi:hypothetical protein